MRGGPFNSFVDWTHLEPWNIITSSQILDAKGRSCMSNVLRGNQVDVSSLEHGRHDV